MPEQEHCRWPSRDMKRWVFDRSVRFPEVDESESNIRVIGGLKRPSLENLHSHRYSLNPRHYWLCKSIQHLVELPWIAHYQPEGIKSNCLLTSRWKRALTLFHEKTFSKRVVLSELTWNGPSSSNSPPKEEHPGPPLSQRIKGSVFGDPWDSVSLEWTD